MKILLLTDMPPCRRHTAGLVLEQLVRFLPKEDVAICAVIDPALIKGIEIPADLSDIPALILEKPFESLSKRLFYRLLTFAASSKRFFYRFLPVMAQFIKQQRKNIKDFSASEDVSRLILKKPFQSIAKYVRYGFSVSVVFIVDWIKKMCLRSQSKPVVAQFAQKQNEDVANASHLGGVPEQTRKRLFKPLLKKILYLFLTITRFTFELIQGIRVRLHLLPKIRQFAQKQHIDKLWVILEGQTMIRMARPLAKSLNVPLFTQVWDPFEWWLRANNIDPYTQKRFLKEYDKVIRYSTSCATASWAMSEAYSKKYGVKNLPIIASLPQEYSKTPAMVMDDNEQQFVIGIAGQFYAVDAWQSFIAALEKANWRIGNKNIFIRAIGGYSRTLAAIPKNFEDLGWKTQEETLVLLADTHLLYMPYWFCDEFRLESSYSFPSKLVSYFCAGRPVFCHAPLYASPAKYILEKEAGYLCPSLDADFILDRLEHVITDRNAYQQMAIRGKECFLQNFTLGNMKSTFSQFLEIQNG